MSGAPVVPTAHELYRAGRLDEAIAALGAELRDDPADTRRRTFLFELLCFAGNFERAQKQLDVLSQESARTQDKESALGVLTYEAILSAERARQEMFADARYPREDAEPESVAGTLNGEQFASLRDADGRIGARLEVLAGSQYLWLPLDQVAAVSIGAPQQLRDLLWMEADIRMRASDGERRLREVYVPAISPLSWREPNDAVRLGRETHWRELDGGTEVPVGQKLLLVDGDEFPVLQVREIVIAARPAARSAAPTE